MKLPPPEALVLIKLTGLHVSWDEDSQQFRIATDDFGYYWSVEKDADEEVWKLSIGAALDIRRGVEPTEEVRRKIIDLGS